MHSSYGEGLETDHNRYRASPLPDKPCLKLLNQMGLILKIHMYAILTAL